MNSSTTCTTALQSIHTPLRSTDCTAENTATKPVNAAQELSGPKETRNNKDSRTVEETQRKGSKESRADRSAWTGFSIEELLKPFSTQGTHSDAKTTTTVTTTIETSFQQQNTVCDKDVADNSTVVTRTNEAVPDNTSSVSSQVTTEKGKSATDSVVYCAQRSHESVTGALDKTIDGGTKHQNKDNSTSEKGLTIAITADAVSGSTSSDGNVSTSTQSAIEGEKSKSSEINSEPKNTDSSKNGEIVSPETRETLSLFDAVHSMLSNISGESGTSYRTPESDTCESAEKVSHKEGSQTCGSSEKTTFKELVESVDDAQRSSEKAGQGKITGGIEDAETGAKLAPPGRSYRQADFDLKAPFQLNDGKSTGGTDASKWC